MASFGDLLRNVNDRLGYNAEDPDRVDNNVNWKLSFSARPKRNVDLNMEKKVECVVAEDGARSESEKTSSKLKINHGDCTTSYTFANDKMAIEGKGKAVDDDGWRVDLTGAVEVKQAKAEWKVSGAMDIKAADLGGAKLAMNIPAEYNQKQAVTVKPKINLEIADEFNVGVSAKWDTKTFLEIWPQIVYKPADSKNSFYWLRADLTRSFVSAGCDQQLKDGINHSFEAVYGWKDFKGIQGHPVSLRGGVEYELSDQTSTTVSANWHSAYDISNEVTHKIDNHWTVSCTQSFDGDAVTKKQNPYHIGFAASYKL